MGMTDITPRIAAEIAAHEGIVLEAYRDSVGVWTWSAGVTDASGHKVGRYRDNPTTLKRALEVYLWLLRTKYLPPVLRAFKGVELTEAQLAAAISFHWNTGAIERASWVKTFVAGKVEQAEREIMNWTKPASLIERRSRERDLFFHGKWTNNGTALQYAVNKPSYTPYMGRRVNVLAPIKELMGVS